MKRLEFNRKTRRLIIQRAAGKCEVCKAALKAGEGEIDHILPAVLGGSAEISNGRLLCRVCHCEKSADDIRRARKADKQRDKATGAIRPKGQIASRPKPEKPETKPPLPFKALFASRTAP